MSSSLKSTWSESTEYNKVDQTVFVSQCSFNSLNVNSSSSVNKILHTFLDFKKNC